MTMSVSLLCSCLSVMFCTVCASLVCHPSDIHHASAATEAFAPTYLVDRGHRKRVCQTERTSARRTIIQMGKRKADPAHFPRAQLPIGLAKPRLVVFDLDNTLWSPELYQLRRAPKAGKDIWLFEAAQGALLELATETGKWEGTRVAVASRTNQVEWAKSLLSRFEAAPGVTIQDLVVQAEIFPGSKRKHFQNLKRDTGVPFSEMIFFDDSTMNTREMEMMGILCVHCPRGLTFAHWETGLLEFARMKEEGVDFMGSTVSVSSARKRLQSDTRRKK